MRKLLFLLSLSVAAIFANGQTAIPVSHLHGNIESVELVSGDIYLVAINPLTDGSGQSTGTAISDDGTFVIWRNCKRYVVTDTNCPTCYSFGSSVLVEVTGEPGNGQPALGNVEIVNETPDGIGSFVANAGTDIQQCLLAYYAAKMDGSSTNELQTISIDGSNVTLSDGGGTVSIDDADADPANEIQDLSEVLAQGADAGATVITNLADGVQATDAATFGQVQAAQTAAQDYADANDDVDDADADPANEIQTLTFDGDTLTISGGNTVDLSPLSDGNGIYSGDDTLGVGYTKIFFDKTENGGLYVGDPFGDSGGIASLYNSAVDAGRVLLRAAKNNGTTYPDASVQVSAEGIDPTVSIASNLDFGDTQASANFRPTTGVLLEHRIRDGGIKRSSIIVNTSTGIVVTDGNQNGGAKYAADYSANYTDRSLVDREYVDTEIASVQGDTSSTNEIQDLASVLAEGNDADGLKIANLANGTAATDAATFGQVQAAQTAAQAYADANDDVDDADADPANELQTISISGTDLTLSNGGGTVSLDDADADPENEGKLYLTAGGANSSVINSTTPNSPAITIEGVGVNVNENLETNTITLTSGDGSATNELDTLVNTGGTLLVNGDTINSSNDFWYTAPNDMSGFFPPLAVYLNASGQVQPGHAPTGSPAQYVLAEKDGQRVRLVSNGTVDWPTPGGPDGQRWLNTGGGSTTTQPTENVQPLYTKTGDLMVVNVHPGFEFVPDAALIPVTVQVLAPNSPVPGAGTELDNAAWVVPAEYNGYTVVKVSDGIITKGSGSGDVQVQALVLSADRSGSSTFGTCTLAASGVVDSSTASHVLTTGEAILGTVLANTMATPPNGMTMTLFLEAP